MTKQELIEKYRERVVLIIVDITFLQENGGDTLIIQERLYAKRDTLKEVIQDLKDME